jgi:hypothetical protein
MCSRLPVFLQIIGMEFDHKIFNPILDAVIFDTSKNLSCLFISGDLFGIEEVYAIILILVHNIGCDVASVQNWDFSRCVPVDSSEA